ncbi:uncharacterized protein TRAVEDRAFT_145942 [Trametes versicolor FP-101664 SS1]|uniref:uncharacterized protein n=1 Tax=Trametes versicolor (strain FP-101664) TaxID=717944 RepID=UPI00046243C3|nr:uncharacterized protein TRAVEDRAFT_145942 [Trametes versicolor FP-101664 SS1]EIW60501.1 hypothetical protein TRAVEDRAFT_145942 [Trametes versicolor FP-101664 SS1]
MKPDSEGDQTPRICPRCNNPATIRVKSRMWFELCFVPLIPMSSKHLWLCTICQWSVPLQQGWEPALPGNAFQPGAHGQWQAPPYGLPPNAAQRGYQPGYPATSPKA